MVKERVELYLYSPSGLSWPLLGLTYTFIFILKSYEHITYYFVTFQYDGVESCQAGAFGEVLTADTKQVDTVDG